MFLSLSRVVLVVTLLVHAPLLETLLGQQLNCRAEQVRHKIAPPRKMLGFAPGTDRTIADWQQITTYFNHLGKQSDRVQVQVVGKTSQGRQIIAVFISAPETLQNLHRFSKIQRLLADPRIIKDEIERDSLINQGKTVVAVTCSMNPVEVVASQMSMQLAYDLATAQDAATQQILNNTIVILIPSGNPDGLDMVAAWYRKTLNTPYEGTLPPEFSRPSTGREIENDWFSLNLKETKALANLLWKEWLPHIVYDIRQKETTGSQMTIEAPYEPPVLNLLPLLANSESNIGHRIAKDLQTTDFRADIVNTGREDKIPSDLKDAAYYHNAIGIVTRTASARLMTPVTIKSQRSTTILPTGNADPPRSSASLPDDWRKGRWSPRDIMLMEMMTVRSLLSQAAQNRRNYILDAFELCRANVSSLSYWPLAYLIQPGQGNDASMAQMISSLLTQGIEVQVLDRELHIDLAPRRHRMFSTPSMLEAPVGSYIIFLAQPYNSLIRTLLDPRKFSHSRFENKEKSSLSNALMWTLPVLMGIETIPISNIVESEPVRRLTVIRRPDQVYRHLGLEFEEDSKSSFPNPIKEYRRLAIYKSWIGSTDEAWTQYVLTTFNIPYKLLFDQHIRRGGLEGKYDAIILPSQSPEEILYGHMPNTYPLEYIGGITDRGVEHLRHFVEDGGTLICLGAASEFAIRQFRLPLDIVASTKIDLPALYHSGAVMQIDVNTSHPIGHLLSPCVDAYGSKNLIFTISEGSAVKPIARYAESSSAQVGLSPNARNFRDRVAIAEISAGRGRIILFGFSPQHNGQTWGTFRFLFNTIATSINKSSAVETRK